MEPFHSQNCVIHGTVPYILRQKHRYIYISINIWSWTFGVSYMEPFRSLNLSVHWTIPFNEQFCIDKCRWTFGMHYMDLFRSKNCSVHGTVLFMEPFHSQTVPYMEPFRSRKRSAYSTTKAQINIYKYRYMQLDFWCALYGTVPFTEPFCFL